MQIYLTHSRKLDYKPSLYLPIRKSQLNNKHQFILPHEESDDPFDSKSIITKGTLDLLIAEISIQSTSQGIELGWADISGVPIAFLYKPNSYLSSSLRKVSNLFIPYSNDLELIEGLNKIIKQIKSRII